MEYDFIVVGGGIAGSILTWELQQQKARVLLVDDPTKSKASLIAAGVINPITGRRLSKCWELERCLAHALPFYESIEKLLPRIQNEKIFHPRPILRVLKNKDEVDVIQKRLLDPEYQPYLGPAILEPGTWNEELFDSYGSIEFKGGGFLDIPELLNRLHAHFQKSDCMRKEWFNVSEVKIDKEGCTWNQIHARRIILCEGSLGKFNTRFTHKPIIDPVKGEILLLEGQIEGPLNDYVINYGHWALPIQTQGIIKIGATFDRENVDDLAPTENAQKSLLESFRSVFKKSEHFTIKDHVVGQRACTADNRPIIGSFPEDPAISIFNGLGAKASLYAPFWAQHLAQHLIHGTAIDRSVNVERFLKW